MLHPRPPGELCIVKDDTTCNKLKLSLLVGRTRDGLGANELTIRAAIRSVEPMNDRAKIRGRGADIIRQT